MSLAALFLVLLIAATSIYGQAVTGKAAPHPFMLAWAEGPGDQEGPDHTIYKKGYDLVLSEKWNEAQKLFAELTTKYPKSEYTDDARYWSAYALMHTDLQRALNAYQEFTQKYPASSYADDAMADMHSIQAQMELARATGQLNSIRGTTVMTTPRPPKAARGFSLGGNLRQIERNARMMSRRGRAMVYSLAPFADEERKLDAKTRLKLDALQALGENTDDEKGFATLKEMALDTRQPLVLRREALNQLSGFEKQDVDAVYLEIVRKDTSEDMQITAIENLGESSEDKEKIVETFVQLYTSLPEAKEEQRATVLYRIADIGNDRAVDFLSRVARSDADYDMRSDAVYYLGSIGGEKARGVLYDILKND
jgi:HEAT repeat protein